MPVATGTMMDEIVYTESDTCAARHTPSPPPLSSVRERGDPSPPHQASADLGVRGNDRPARLRRLPSILFSEQ